MIWDTKRPPCNKPCKIRTKNGEEFTARLIHLNPQFHRKVECLDVWIIKGHKSINADDVVEWTLTQ